MNKRKHARALPPYKPIQKTPSFGDINISYINILYININIIYNILWGHMPPVPSGSAAYDSLEA